MNRREQEELAMRWTARIAVLLAILAALMLAP